MFGLTRVTPNFFLHHGFCILRTDVQTADSGHDKDERTGKEPDQTAVQVALRRLGMTVMVVVMVMMMVVMVMVVRRFRRTVRRNVHGNETAACRTFAHDVARTAGFHHAARTTVSASDGVFHFLAVFFERSFFMLQIYIKNTTYKPASLRFSLSLSENPENSLSGVRTAEPRCFCEADSATCRPQRHQVSSDG